MASIIQRHESDMLINYSQNDKKYDGWASKSVANLNKELEATVKDKVSTYFDENSFNEMSNEDGKSDSRI